MIGQHELRNDDNNNGNGSGNGNLNNVGKDYHSMAGFDSFRYGVIKGTSSKTAKKVSEKLKTIDRIERGRKFNKNLVEKQELRKKSQLREHKKILSNIRKSIKTVRNQTKTKLNVTNDKSKEIIKKQNSEIKKVSKNKIVARSWNKNNEQMKQRQNTKQQNKAVNKQQKQNKQNKQKKQKQRKKEIRLKLSSAKKLPTGERKQLINRKRDWFGGKDIKWE